MPLIDWIPGRAVIPLLYCLPVPGWTLKLAPVIHRQYPVTSDNDCVFIQAFGRNRWPDHLLELVIAIIRQSSAGDAMTALQRANFDPGQSNRDLARHAWELFSNRPVPIIAQWEVAYAMYAADPERYRERLQNAGLIHVLWPRGAYYPTWEVKKDSVSLAVALRLSRPIELAHPDMAARSIAIIWRLGMRPSPRIVPVTYDPDSVQKWTKGVRQWWPRNALGHAHHLLHGWVRLNPPKPS